MMCFGFVESPLFTATVSEYLPDDGVRVCYYVRTHAGQILLLLIYAKSVRASIPGVVLKALKEELDDDPQHAPPY